MGRLPLQIRTREPFGVPSTIVFPESLDTTENRGYLHGSTIFQVYGAAMTGWRRIRLSAGPRGLLASAFISCPGRAAARVAAAAPVVAKPEVNAAVTVTDNGRTWTLDNGIVKATINKGNGNMTSLVYHGVETMGAGRILGANPARRAPIDPNRHD